MNEKQSFEQELEQAIRDLSVEPGSRFYVRMAGAPWKQPAGKSPLRHVLIGTAVAAALALVVYVVPPLRALAQEIIDELFVRADSDNTTFIHEAVHEPIDIEPEYSSFATVEQLKAAIGSDILFPATDIPGYSLESIVYTPEVESIVALYEGPPGRGLVISLYTPGSHLDIYGTVGQSAQVTDVILDEGNRDISGSYVEGSWVVYPTEMVPTPQSDGLVEQPAEWLNTSPARRLRWQFDGWVYEITAMGGSGDLPDRDLMLEDLIAIAESLYNE